MNVGGSGVDLPGLYLLAVIVNFAAVLWASGVAMRLRTMQAGPVMQFPVFLVLFFAPVYVPLDAAPGLDPHRRDVNPLTRVLEAGRGLLAGTPTQTGGRVRDRLRPRRGVLRLGAARAAQRRARRLTVSGTVKAT